MSANGVFCERYGETGPHLVMLHAQLTDHRSFVHAAAALADRCRVWLPDCPGHGESIHDPAAYTLTRCGKLLSDWIDNTIGGPFFLLGHSSGGMMAAWIAAHNPRCERLILEDPPLFSCEGERQLATSHYYDISETCSRFLAQREETDFVLYYFKRQRAWRSLPGKTGEETRAALIARAEAFRREFPDRDLKIAGWPCGIFRGMNRYDPAFGDAVATGRFNDVSHETLLRRIKAPTLFLKADTEYDADGLLACALSDVDAAHASYCIPDCRIERFDCGHGIHIAREKRFLESVSSFLGL